MAESRNDTTRGLIRAGVLDLTGAQKKFESLRELFDSSRIQCSSMLEALSTVADPDTALAAYAQLCSLYTQSGDSQMVEHMAPYSPHFPRLLAVLGASEQMGRLMASRPQLISAVVDDSDFQAATWNIGQREAALFEAVGANGTDSPVTATKPFEEAVSALRLEYYRQLAAIMAYDVTNEPVGIQPTISDALSDLAESALRAALSIAYSKIPDSRTCRFAVIAMGKLGAHELNYVSDVDLIYVVEPVQSSKLADGQEPSLQSVLSAGTKIGVCMQHVCSSALPGVAEPALWEIDGALRPEGKDGQLVRTLSSHEEYYKSWAKNWEFQALLKARCVAGDAQLGSDYEKMADGFVWQASTRQNFVFDCQQMRRRVEKLIPEKLVDREIKLGKGGLRDVEFTVQMLQLVHGRTDESLRSSGTLAALEALSAGGYVSRGQAERLGTDYRFERVLEHRAQMWGLRRTHLFPDLGSANNGGLDSKRIIKPGSLDGNAELHRLARAFGLSSEKLVERYDATRNEVRRLHLDIYYRPMLPQIAQLSEGDISLTGAAARARYESIGFDDPDAAIRHVEHLTEGISRSAKINRVILPAMLQWLGEGQNPDMGLLTLRKLEESFGQESEYLGFLRDSLSAGHRLCSVVSNSRYLADALTKSVESVTWLGDDALLAPRTRESLDVQANLSVRRFSDLGEFATSIRALRRHEIERIGLAWMTGLTKSSVALRAMTDVYDALIDASLRWAMDHQSDGMENAPASLAILAMGRYGGREVNFSSDADMVVMYERTPAAQNSQQAGDFALKVLNDVRSILSGPVSTEPGIDLDFDLRPEGKNGGLVRTYDFFCEYYQKWASTWEHQALLRARYAAGNRELANRFLTQVADPLRYPRKDLEPSEIQEIRKLKARMEAERLPRGVQRERHLKLGKGGLSDVEWTVQFLQLRYSGRYESLRTVSTIEALRELAKVGLIAKDDASSLEAAWKLTTDARNANFLWQGRANRADVLPDDTYSLGGISACMRRGARRGQDFENDLLGAMRHCREVTDRLFYGNEESSRHSKK